MIETKKERRESKMIKISYIITFFVVLTFFNTNTFAETKLDCTKYSTKTYLGLLDKMRCKKGLPVKERIKPKKFSDLNPFKPRDKSGKIISKKTIPCHELSTKNFVDLMAKLKCEKKFGYK